VNPLPVGTKAPDFALPLRVGEAPLRLSDYLGERSVVILFFPLAFSGVCTQEMCQVQEELGAWGELDATVLGISVDSIWVTQRFAAEHNLTYPILSDFNKEAMTAYGVRNDDFFGMRGVANRSVFVVDREGSIVYSWMSEDADILPDFQAVQEVLKTAQAPSAG
jgi:peroxiredoxin